MIYVLRGIAGAGKSTWANEHCSYVCSADDYFMVGGKYLFDKSKIGKAHERCFEKYLHRCEELDRELRKDCKLAIANTNIELWEMTPYFAMAKYHNIPYEIIRFNCSVEKSLERNVHNVPKEAIESMAKRLLPLPKRFGNETVIET